MESNIGEIILLYKLADNIICIYNVQCDVVQSVCTVE